MAFENELIPVNTLGVQDEETGKWIPVDAVALRSHTDRLTIEEIRQSFEDIKNSLTNVTKETKDSGISVKWFGAKGDGITDDTLPFQKALDMGGKIIVPFGTYLVGQLRMKSNSQLVGNGKPLLKHNIDIPSTSPFPRAMISNQNLPSYKTPSDPTREYHAGLDSNISIDNIDFDGMDNDIYGIQMVCVDFVNITNCFVRNTSGGTDFRAVRDAYVSVSLNNIKEDGVSVSDQNFKPKFGERGISTRIVFENCLVENSCLVNTNNPPDANAYEIDDGMSFIYFVNCGAINNQGSGFEIHVHTTEYDVTDIFYINCYAINNVPSVGVDRTVAGFHLGQTPSESAISRIVYQNCTSIGSPNAFAGSPGSQSGKKDVVSILGGYWESGEFFTTEARDMRKTAILLKKHFSNFTIEKAVIVAPKDGFGIYTYQEGNQLTVSNNIFKDCYVAARLGHFEGNVEFVGNQVYFGELTTAPYSAFVYINTKSAIVKNNRMEMLAENYSSSIIRLNGVQDSIVDGNIVTNKGIKQNNAFQVDTVEECIIAKNIVKNFDTAVFLSNDSTSVIIDNNSFKTCNKVVNRPSAPFVIIGKNADQTVNNLGWENAELKNGWKSSRTPRYKKIGDIVTVSGAVNSGSVGSTIFILPEGYRPSYAVTYVQYNSGTAGKTVVMSIGIDGAVSISSVNSNVNTDYVVLDWTFGIG